MLLQIIIGAMILVAWASAVAKFRKKKLSLGEFGLWSLLWFVLLITSVFPNIPSQISKLVGIGRGVDLVIYGSIFVIFLILFKLYVRMEEQERNMTELVRQLAIKKVKKK